jgi:chromosome segregation ATPase
MKQLILIAAALGWLERPNTDGIFLQEEEAGKIEQILADNAAALTAAQTALSTAAQDATDKINAFTARITELEGEISTVTADKTSLKDQLTTKSNDLTIATNRIAELEQMEGKPSGTVATQDPANGPTTEEKNKKYLTVYDTQFS